MDLGLAHECCFEVDVFVCWEWIEELEWVLLLRIQLSFLLGPGQKNQFLSFFLSFFGLEDPSQSLD